MENTIQDIQNLNIVQSRSLEQCDPAPNLPGKFYTIVNKLIVAMLGVKEELKIIE